MSSDKQVPIFVISLVEAKKRREFIAKQMREHGLKYEFFDAIFGEDLSKEFLAKFKIQGAFHTSRRSISKMELGCLFSHYHLLQKIIKNGLSEAIIMEDDAACGKEFTDLVKSFDSIAEGWDLLQLGYWNLFFNHTEHRYLLGHFYPLSFRYSEKIKINGKNKHYMGPLIDSTEGTHCYAINLEGAKKLVRLIDEEDLAPLDCFFNYINHLIDRFAIVPPLVWQNRREELEQHIEESRIKAREFEAPGTHRGSKINLLFAKIPWVRGIWEWLRIIRRIIKISIRVLFRRPRHKLGI